MEIQMCRQCYVQNHRWTVQRSNDNKEMESNATVGCEVDKEKYSTITWNSVLFRHYLN